jgi:hypothetical protein
MLNLPPLFPHLTNEERPESQIETLTGMERSILRSRLMRRTGSSETDAVACCRRKEEIPFQRGAERLHQRCKVFLRPIKIFTLLNSNLSFRSD